MRKSSATEKEGRTSVATVPELISPCCHSRVRVEGRTTCWYVCAECGLPCDPFRQGGA